MRLRALSAAGLVYFPNQILKWEPAAHILLLVEIPADVRYPELAIFEIIFIRDNRL